MPNDAMSISASDDLQHFRRPEVDKLLGKVRTLELTHLLLLGGLVATVQLEY